MKRVGDEPVTFNFFPGVRRDGELAVADGGRVLSFRNVELECSAAPGIEKGFLILDPYSLQRRVGVKPVRAWVELRDRDTFTIRISVGP